MNRVRTKVGGAADEMIALAGGLIPEQMLPKRSAPWLEWRRLGVSGSEVSSLIYNAECIGVDLSREVAGYLGKPPAWVRTPRQMWRERKGQPRNLSGNPNIERGRRLEAPARALFNERYRTECRPYCFVDAEKPHRRVSLDGFDQDRGVLIGIRAPVKKPAEAPAYLVAQLAYQWAVLRKGYRVRKTGIVIVMEVSGKKEIFPLTPPKVPGLGKAVLDVADAFWACLTGNREPGMAGSDAVIRMDAEFLETAAAYLVALDEYEKTKSKKEVLRKRLEDLATKLGDYPQIGGKVRVERQVRRGTVDYRKALEKITGMPKAELEARIEEYRKAPLETFEIRDLRR